MQLENEKLRKSILTKSIQHPPSWVSPAVSHLPVLAFEAILSHKQNDHSVRNSKRPKNSSQNSKIYSTIHRNSRLNRKRQLRGMREEATRCKAKRGITRRDERKKKKNKRSAHGLYRLAHLGSLLAKYSFHSPGRVSFNLVACDHKACQSAGLAATSN